MSLRINDGLGRSSRTRVRRRALGLCPDCGGSDRILISRCFECRVKRNALRKIVKNWEMVGDKK